MNKLDVDGLKRVIDMLGKHEPVAEAFRFSPEMMEELRKKVPFSEKTKVNGFFGVPIYVDVTLPPDGWVEAFGDRWVVHGGKGTFSVPRTRTDFLKQK